MLLQAESERARASRQRRTARRHSVQSDRRAAHATQLPQDIPITFSKSLRAATVNASTIQVTVSEADRPARPVAGRITYDDASRTAQFMPEQGFRDRSM